MVSLAKYSQAVVIIPVWNLRVRIICLEVSYGE